METMVASSSLVASSAPVVVASCSSSSHFQSSGNPNAVSWSRVAHFAGQELKQSGGVRTLGARRPGVSCRAALSGGYGAPEGVAVALDVEPGPEAIPIEKEVLPIEKEVLPIEKRFAAFPTILDINQIREILPHRFPFLLVDRVIEYVPGTSAVAIKNVTINDNFFPGHFPERPIMPGVLMVEAMAQVGGIVMLTPDVGGDRESFFFAGVDKVRFRKPVVAGDTLVMRMTLTKLQRKFGIAKMDGKAYVGGEVVCEGEFILALGASSN